MIKIEVNGKVFSLTNENGLYRVGENVKLSNSLAHYEQVIYQNKSYEKARATLSEVVDAEMDSLPMVEVDSVDENYYNNKI